MTVLSLYVTTLEKIFYRMNKMNEENKYLLFLLGFVAASLSPFLAIWYVLHCTTYIISKILVPILGLTLILFIGLPLLCLMKWIYATYAFIYRIIINFCLATMRWLAQGKSNHGVNLLQNRRASTSNIDFELK